MTKAPKTNAALLHDTDTDTDTDTELLQQFRAGTVPAAIMTHESHVRLAWLYVQRWPLSTALAHMRADTRRFAEANGAPGKYHETVTWAWMLMVHERVQRERLAHVDGADEWAKFVRRHPDLLSSDASVLQRYYMPETLASEVARSTFVWPDRAPGAIQPRATQLIVDP